MEPETSPYKPPGPAMLLGLIVGSIVCVAGLVLIIGAVGQLVWMLVAPVFGLEVRL